MKIIEGFLAGRQVQYKEQKGTRVTSDKVRKSVFDVLKGVIDIEGKSVADLFCGSGMYGIEAISRGAKCVLFLDNSKDVERGLKRNLEEIKKKFKTLNAETLNKKFEYFLRDCDKKFDLVFADPPYYEFDFKKFNSIYKILKKGGIFVLESSKRVEVGELDGLELIVEKKYGDTKILFFRKGR